MGTLNDVRRANSRAAEFLSERVVMMQVYGLITLISFDMVASVDRQIRPFADPLYTALSRLKQGFDSPRERQWFQ